MKRIYEVGLVFFAYLFNSLIAPWAFMVRQIGWVGSIVSLFIVTLVFPYAPIRLFIFGYMRIRVLFIKRRLKKNA